MFRSDHRRPNTDRGRRPTRLVAVAESRLSDLRAHDTAVSEVRAGYGRVNKCSDLTTVARIRTGVVVQPAWWRWRKVVCLISGLTIQPYRKSGQAMDVSINVQI